MSDDVSRFVYVTYIYTTPEKLWAALTKPEFTRQYWMGTHQESDWRKGSSWELKLGDGRLADSGEIVEIDPPKRLVLTWRHELSADTKAEGHSTCTYDIAPHTHGSVKLTVTHEMPKPKSKLIDGVATGWPEILSNLKTLLEMKAPA